MSACFTEKYPEVFYPERACPCPHCVDQRAPKWPCGRPKRDWETPVPAPIDYPVTWPQYTCGQAVAYGDTHQAMHHGPMSGTGATHICN